MMDFDLKILSNRQTFDVIMVKHRYLILIMMRYWLMTIRLSQTTIISQPASYVEAKDTRERIDITELNGLLPRMSPLNLQCLPKKQSVFQKIVAFVEKFKVVGGDV